MTPLCESSQVLGGSEIFPLQLKLKTPSVPVVGMNNRRSQPHGMPSYLVHFESPLSFKWRVSVRVACKILEEQTIPELKRKL